MKKRKWDSFIITPKKNIDKIINKKLNELDRLRKNGNNSVHIHRYKNNCCSDIKFIIINDENSYYEGDDACWREYPEELL